MYLFGLVTSAKLECVSKSGMSLGRQGAMYTLAPTLFLTISLKTAPRDNMARSKAVFTSGADVKLATIPVRQLMTKVLVLSLVNLLISSVRTVYLVHNTNLVGWPKICSILT